MDTPKMMAYKPCQPLTRGHGKSRVNLARIPSQSYQNLADIRAKHRRCIPLAINFQDPWPKKSARRNKPISVPLDSRTQCPVYPPR